jgi:ATP/maltotriose-dependent transcriptional regulator MalT
VDDTLAAVLEERSEGWVTGLRLAALSLHQRSDLDRVLT